MPHHQNAKISLLNSVIYLTWYFLKINIRAQEKRRIQNVTTASNLRKTEHGDDDSPLKGEYPSLHGECATTQRQQRIGDES